MSFYFTHIGWSQLMIILNQSPPLLPRQQVHLDATQLGGEVMFKHHAPPLPPSPQHYLLQPHILDTSTILKIKAWPCSVCHLGCGWGEQVAWQRRYVWRARTLPIPANQTPWPHLRHHHIMVSPFSVFQPIGNQHIDCQSFKKRIASGMELI